MSMKTAAQRIEIPRQANAHGWLAKGDGSLAGVISRSEVGSSWHFEIDETNAHNVEGLYRLSLDCRATALFSLASASQLDSATREFLGDFARRALLEDSSRTRGQQSEDQALLRAVAPANEVPEKTRLQVAPRILYEGARAWLGDTIGNRHGVERNPERIESPVLIGAYGGEHIGDAAILGGVLLNLYKRFDTRRVVLGSFRPAHTERLVRSLDVPVEVEVFQYDNGAAEERLRDADGLVFAGGPLMDLPNLLVKHWNTAVEARRRGLPFIIDRIGVGPFASWPSRFAARKIARLATSLSVRTAGAARKDELRGLEVQVLEDPAFTYLESRGREESSLTRLREIDRDDVESLFEGAESKFKVGINLRPIRHLWSPDGEDASRRAEAQCLERVADAIRLLDAKLPVRFIFFPMNPIQLGGSDLHSAWRLHNLVGSDPDLRVWQGDPEVDGLFSFIRRLDAALTMRFHACIFSLSAGIPTLGIDYYAHAGGKVGELFRDRSLSDDATRIDTLETPWLSQKLEAIARSAGYSPQGPVSKE
jgi:polysaccharide pyruvyl transferase WcaK-like protein